MKTTRATGAKKKTQSKPKTAAVLTIKDAALMTPEGREALVYWLDFQAALLLVKGKTYPSKYKSQYLYESRRRTSA